MFEVYFGDSIGYKERTEIFSEIDSLMPSPPFNLFLREGEPDLDVYPEGSWKNFPVPTEDCTIYVFDGDEQSVGYGGGTLDYGRIGVAVFDRDSVEDIGLRIWHEALHGVGAPVDDLEEMFPEWVSSLTTRLLYLMYRKFGVEVERPYFLKKFYRYLSNTSRYHGMNGYSKCVSRKN